MGSIDRLQRGARRRLSDWIRPTDPNDLVSLTAYYPQQPTCQIPHLWWLYSSFLGDREQGYFVEIGAYDGVFVSNTWGLAERAWTGIMVEPVPRLALACTANHAHHPNVRVIQRAVGPEGVDEITLMLAETLTTANAEVFGEYSEIDWASSALTDSTLRVPSQTLDSLLEESLTPSGFDVLVVDVEGFEDQVFSGFSLAEWRPKLLIVELADTHPDLTATSESDARLGVKIASGGYRVVFKDSVNTVFVREDVWAASYHFE